MLLLLIYFFIALPVQFFHHHDVTSTTKNISKEAGFSASSDKENATCRICEHKYPVYTHPVSINSKILVNTEIVFISTYRLLIPQCFQRPHPNKGPPFGFA